MEASAERLRAALLATPDERMVAFLRDAAHQRCEYNGHGQCTGALERVRPMTAYGDEPDHYLLCRGHAEEYCDHWTEQWAEYYSGVL